VYEVVEKSWEYKLKSVKCALKEWKKDFFVIPLMEKERIRGKLEEV
jgi:hypothetical protein